MIHQRLLDLSQDMDASDWVKGIFFSVLASVIGASAKLAIRKSWLIEAELEAAAQAVFMSEDSHHSTITTSSSRRRCDHDDVEGQLCRRSQHGTYVGPRLEDLQPTTTRTRSSTENRQSQQEREPLPDVAGNASIVGALSSESSYHTSASMDLIASEVEGDEERGGGVEACPLDELPDEQNTQPRQPQPELGNRRRGRSVYEAVQSEQLPPCPSPSCSHASSLHSHNHNSNHRDDDDFEDDDILGLDFAEEPHGCCCARCSSCCCNCCSSYCCPASYFTKSRLMRWFGMFNMSVANPAACVVAMNYASPSILAPFSGLTLVWVIVFSQPLIGEAPTLVQKVASILIVVGEVTVAIFGDHSSDDDATVESVLASYKEPAFLLFFLGLALWMLLLSLWIYTPESACWNSPTLRRFAWGASGGSLTGLQNFLKDALVVIKKAPSLRHISWCVPVFALLQIAASFGGLLFLTGAMKRYDASFTAAMFVGSFVFSTSIMSAAHYHTFQHLEEVIDIVMYPVGLLILMLGVTILILLGSSHGDGGGAHHGVVTDGDDEDEDSDRIILTSPSGVQYLHQPGESSGGGDAVAIHHANNNPNNSTHEKGEIALAKSPTSITGTLSTRSAAVSATTTEDDPELVSLWTGSAWGVLWLVHVRLLIHLSFVYS